MSEKAATEFALQLTMNPALQEELGAIVASTSDPSAIVSRVIAFAAARGFEVTAEELAQSGSLPLTDAQLAHVSGGAETVHLYLRRR